MIKIQIQRPNGQWMTIAHCSNNEGIISSRLKKTTEFHKRARAVDSKGKILDIM